jgi:hypothetical protein
VRCSHTYQIKIVTPSALGCEDCLRMGSGWGWCYIDDIEVDLASQTAHNGPIPRFI